MTLNEFLIRKAERQLESQGRIDIDLHYQLLAEGLDTETIERKFNNAQKED